MRLDQDGAPAGGVDAGIVLASGQRQDAQASAKALLRMRPGRDDGLEKAAVAGPIRHDDGGPLRSCQAVQAAPAAVAHPALPAGPDHPRHLPPQDRRSGALEEAFALPPAGPRRSARSSASATGNLYSFHAGGRVHRQGQGMRALRVRREDLHRHQQPPGSREPVRAGRAATPIRHRACDRSPVAEATSAAAISKVGSATQSTSSSEGYFLPDLVGHSLGSSPFFMLNEHSIISSSKSWRIAR